MKAGEIMAITMCREVDFAWTWLGRGRILIDLDCDRDYVKRQDDGSKTEKEFSLCRRNHLANNYSGKYSINVE